MPMALTKTSPGSMNTQNSASNPFRYIGAKLNIPMVISAHSSRPAKIFQPPDLTRASP